MRSVEVILWIMTVAAMGLLMLGFTLLEGAGPARETISHEAQETSQDYGP